MQSLNFTIPFSWRVTCLNSYPGRRQKPATLTFNRLYNENYYWAFGCKPLTDTREQELRPCHPIDRSGSNVVTTEPWLNNPQSELGPVPHHAAFWVGIDTQCRASTILPFWLSSIWYPRCTYRIWCKVLESQALYTVGWIMTWTIRQDASKPSLELDFGFV